MSPNVFVSYRRSDTDFEVQWLRMYLHWKFGKDAVFFDVTHISKATHFWDEIRAALEVCEMVLVAIGPKWLETNSENEEGPRGNPQPRLFEDDDYVRREIEFALEREIPIMPIFIRGAKIPKTEQIPKSINALLHQNGVVLQPGRGLEASIDEVCVAIGENTSLKESKYHYVQAEHRERVALLDKIDKTWIMRVLLPSLWEQKAQELQKTDCPALAHQAFGEVHATENEERKISAYEWRGLLKSPTSSLCIIGAAGSGKTTTLLQIAQDQLEEARRDPTAKIPLVLHLSTWRHQEFREWLNQEISVQYRVRVTAAKKWLEDGHLLLLLDGLDEVSSSHRSQCAKAALEFQQKLAVPMVVTSREQAFVKELSFDRVVRLEPMSSEQVEHILEQGGPRFSNLKMVFSNDSDLKQLAKTPLNLNLILKAVDGEDEDENESQLDSGFSTKAGIFSHYVERMFSRYSRAGPTHSKASVERALACLARYLQKSDETLLNVHNLQPEELLPSNLLKAYYLLTRFGTGLLLVLLLEVSRYTPRPPHIGPFERPYLLMALALLLGAGIGVLNHRGVNWKLGVYWGAMLMFLGLGFGPYSAISLLPLALFSCTKQELVKLPEVRLQTAATTEWTSVGEFFKAQIEESRERTDYLSCMGPVFAFWGLGALLALLVRSLGADSDTLFYPVIGVVALISLVTLSRDETWGLGVLNDLLSAIGVLIKAGCQTIFVSFFCLLFLYGSEELFSKFVPEQVDSAVALKVVGFSVIALFFTSLFFEGLLKPLLTTLVAVPVMGFRYWVMRFLLAIDGSLPLGLTKLLDSGVERSLLRRLTDRKIGSSYIFIHKELLEHFAGLPNTDSSN